MNPNSKLKYFNTVLSFFFFHDVEESKVDCIFVSKSNI